MSLKVEVAELMNQPGRVYDVAEKTQYNLNMNTEDKEIAEILDNWVRNDLIQGDGKRELAQFINRTVSDEIYKAPDYLLDSLFERGSVGEFDDYQVTFAPQNTLTAYEAAKGGNVDRSYLNFSTITPSTRNLQIETDLSYVDMRRNGWKSVANLTTYMTESLRNKQFYQIFNDIDAAITGGEQKIDVTGAEPTMEAMDALTLYLNEYSDGSVPFTVSLAKYASKMRRMTGYAEYLSDAMKDEFNRYGFAKLYDGVQITSISSAHKLGDGSLLFPDKRIFGIGGKIGFLDQRGETHTYTDYDNNGERIHIMIKDYTYSTAITHIDRVAKIVFSA